MVLGLMGGMLSRIGGEGSGVQAVLLYGERGSGLEGFAEGLARGWLGLGGREVAEDLGRVVDFQRISPFGAGRLIKSEAVTPSRGGRSDDFEEVEGSGESRGKEFDGVPVVVYFRTRPLMYPVKVVWIDQAERFQTGAANAFLKTLEELPPYGRVVLTTTEVGRVLPTIRSRCVCVAVPSVLTEDSGLADWERSFARTDGDLAFVRRHAGIYQALEELMRGLGEGPVVGAMRASDEARALAERLAKESGMGVRESQSRILEGVAGWLSRRRPGVPDAALAAVESSRHLGGNGNPGIAFDTLFGTLSLVLGGGGSPLQVYGGGYGMGGDAE